MMIKLVYWIKMQYKFVAVYLMDTSFHKNVNSENEKFSLHFSF